ncbi:PEP-CTERM sorting domain-containing protein [Rubritalea spongiae]|uniref:PEP-CTERM sorting domain-containing protein n=1 Tax=Rubritalea spongiae TaxID=430797 RepID=A0ABW5E2L7_9BACT
MKLLHKKYTSITVVGLLASIATSNAAAIAISGNQILAGQGNSGELVGTNNATAIQVRNGYALTVEDAAVVNLTSGINISQGVNGSGASITQLGTSDVNVGGNLSLSGNATGGTSSYTMSGGTLDITGDFNSGANYAATFAIVGNSAAVNVGGVLNANTDSLFDFTFGATGMNAINVTGVMSIFSGSELSIDGSSYTGGAGTINLFSYGSAGTADEFAETISGFSGYNTDVVYGATGVDLVLSAVPEPSSSVLLCGGLGLLALRRRR